MLPVVVFSSLLSDGDGVVVGPPTTPDGGTGLVMRFPRIGGNGGNLEGDRESRITATWVPAIRLLTPALPRADLLLVLAL